MVPHWRRSRAMRFDTARGFGPPRIPRASPRQQLPSEKGLAMLVSRVMRAPVTTITADTSVRAAAALMAELDLGVLPVCDKGRPIGMLSDRDIVIRWIPNAVADSSIRPIMTPLVVTCRPDQTVEQVAFLMADRQIRRIVVVDGSGKIAGILTLGDIARDVSEVLAGQTLGEIVELR